MNKKYFRLAAIAAESKKDRRQFIIGACGIRADGAIVLAYNGPVQLFGNQRRSFGPAHAEARLAQKLDVGAVVYVVRISKNNKDYSLARPCDSCQRILKSRGVKKVYYTINNNEYGILYLSSKTDSSHRLRA